MSTTHGPAGALRRDGDTNIIEFERILPAEPDRVWRALTSADGLSAWLAPEVSIDPRIDGAVRLVFDEDNEVTGTITEFDPPRSLSHTWIINGSASSIVHYTLEAVDGGTRLTLTHIGLPDEMSGGYTPGWHAYLVRLDASLAGTEPPEWMAVFQEVAGLYS